MYTIEKKKSAFEKLRNIIGWKIFMLKYKLGLAKEGKDFW